MSSQTQVQDVQQQIEGVNHEVSEVKASLAAAKKDGDKEEVRSLHTQLEQLYKERVALRDKENLLLKAQQGGTDTIQQLVDQAVERKVQLAWPPSKRSRTGYEAYSTLRSQGCDEVKLWNTEVRDAQVSCRNVAIEDVLGACLPQRRLLPDLRYLQLLLADSKYMQTEIGNLIAMRLKRAHSPHTDVELPYHPITLALFQYAAVGQQGLAFFPEEYSVGDSAREDIQCHILGKPLEPSEIKVKEIRPSSDDPDGIHNNKEGLGKIYKCVKTKYLDDRPSPVTSLGVLATRCEAVWFVEDLWHKEECNGNTEWQLKHCHVAPRFSAPEFPAGQLAATLNLESLEDQRGLIGLSEFMLWANHNHAAPPQGFRWLTQYSERLAEMHQLPITPWFFV